MEHLTSGRSKKSIAPLNVESTPKKQAKIIESKAEPVTDSEEPPILLDYHGKINGESSISTRYEYINSFCPGSNMENDESRRQLRR
ncbi:hypothetical protein ACHQM5_022581 [Ranunculus cassubicifolius]